MDNIFKDAKFGDIYVTKDGHKNSFCSFTISNGETIARLYRESWGVVLFYLDGRVHSGTEFGRDIDFDVIGKLEEPIDEKELDRRAYEYAHHNACANEYMSDVAQHYIAGYIDAKEL